MPGSIVRTEGLAAAVAGLPAPVGAVVQSIGGRSASRSEVIGFRGQRTIVYPLGHDDRRAARQPRATAADAAELRVGTDLLGRVIDARGRTIDRGRRRAGRARP